MSHRVTTQTSITNREAAMAAFSKAGVQVKDAGANRFTLTSGRTTGTLNLATGEIVGDTDRWADTDFDALRQAYAEEAYIAELRRTGATVHSRTVDTEGNIVVVYQTTG